MPRALKKSATRRTIVLSASYSISFPVRVILLCEKG